MFEQINVSQAIICVIASQIANLGESIIGAVFQEKEGFQWVSHCLYLILVTGPLAFLLNYVFYSILSIVRVHGSYKSNMCFILCYKSYFALRVYAYS